MNYISELFLFISGLAGGALFTDYKINKFFLSLVFINTLIIAIYTHTVSVKQDTQLKAQTPVFAGVISPGNEEIPKSVSLKIPILQKGQTVILLGNRLAVISNTGHNSILSNGDLSFLSVDIDPAGLMTLSTTLLDSKNNKVVKIINNEFQAFQDFAFLPKQPDPHSLVVRDSDGVEVLNIKYLNPQVIWITGRFQLPGSSEPVVISDDGGLEGPGGNSFINYIIVLEKAGSGAFGFTNNGGRYQATTSSESTK